MPSDVLSLACPTFLLVRGGAGVVVCRGVGRDCPEPPVYMGECLVCLVFGCLLPRMLMGPWC